MRIVKKNPYRIVGLLVGATAREQERQIKRLKQFIEAEQDADADSSFQTLGHIERTIESVVQSFVFILILFYLTGFSITVIVGVNAVMILIVLE